VFTPYSLLWSRASLIEYLAVAGCIGWVWSAALWFDRRRRSLLVIGTVSGVVAMLVKPTTGAFWVMPMLAYGVDWAAPRWGKKLRPIVSPSTLVMIAVPFAAALIWTHHADAIKASQPATVWLTSGNLKGWNFGSLEQRLSLQNWDVIDRRIGGLITGIPFVSLPLGLFAGYRRRHSMFWTAWAAVPVLTIGTFFNLYVVHDYYLTALTPIFAAVLGCMVTRVPWSRMKLRRPLLFVSGILLIVIFAKSVPYVRQAYARVDVNTIIRVRQDVAALTKPTDEIVFEAKDWSPQTAYYTRRSGFIVQSRPSAGEKEALTHLYSEGFRFLVSERLSSDGAADFLRAGPWTGVLSEHVYIVGNTRTELRGAAVAATDTATDLVPLGDPVDVGPTRITCGSNGLEVPGGSGPVILQFLISPSDPSLKIALNSSLGALPLRRYVAIGQEVARDGFAITCRDGDSVQLLAAWRLPPDNI